MAAEKIVEVLPEIAASPPAIGAYVVLVLAILLAYQRRRRSADWSRLLEAAEKDRKGVKELVQEVGYVYDQDSRLGAEQTLALRMKQLRAAVILCVIVAVALLGLSVVQAISGVATKTALLNKMLVEAGELRKRLDIEQTNKAIVSGDLGELEVRALHVGATQIAGELHELRQKFAKTVDQRYVSQAEGDQLKIVDATIAFADRRFSDVALELPELLLERVSQRVQVEAATAHQLNLMAMAARIRGRDYTGAIQCADRILKLAPGNWLALQTKANMLFLLGRYENAVAQLGQIDLKSKEGAVNWILPGDVQGNLDPKADDITRNFQTATEDLPMKDSFRLIGVISWKDPSPCALAEQQEREQFARHWLAGELTSAGKLEDASLLLARAVEICSRDVRLVSSLAMARMRLKDAAGAQPVLKQWTQLENEGLAFYLLGLNSLELKEYATALEALSRAQHFAPKDEGVVLALARTHELMGQFAKELATLTNFLKTTWDPKVARAAASWYIRRQDNRRVAEIETRIIAHNDANAKDFFNRGLAYLLMGQNEEALPNFIKTVELNPKDTQAHLNIASTGGLLQRWGLVEKHAREVINLDADFQQGNAHYYLAFALLNLNRSEEAIEAIKEYVKRNGENFASDHLMFFALGGPSGKPEAEIYCKRLRARLLAKEGDRRRVPTSCGGNFGVTERSRASA